MKTLDRLIKSQALIGSGMISQAGARIIAIEYAKQVAHEALKDAVDRGKTFDATWDAINSDSILNTIVKLP